jgi:outer membrane protein OmpA-like peptidoglycan-associated protein
MTLNVKGQSSATRLKNDGDRYFESGDFRSALHFYRQAGLETSTNETIRLRFGISLYEINDVDGSIRFFQSLINEGKTEPIVFYWLARSLQAKKNFPDAITYYKRFLQRSDPKDPLRTWVTDELIRCANGTRFSYADEIAYIENAGPIINTQYADFGVRYSPTVMDKIYFNSKGHSLSGRPNTYSDIYSASLSNGRWSTPVGLPQHVNTNLQEEVTGFSSDGQVLYYLSQRNNRYEIVSDTFTDIDGASFKGVVTGPHTPARGGTDILFFNDTICLFSSNAPGGYGGYDLYITVLSNKKWSQPYNLGPSVNSFYNERHPFLTRDGLTLFYSSNNLESVGGYDIFRTDFDVTLMTWSRAQNLGFPVNSVLDDTHFMLGADGMTAFITSDRKDGHGEEDIFRIFFKLPVQAHQQISYLPTFYHVIKSKGEEAFVTPIPEAPVEIKEYFISHLFIDESGEVLTPQNLKKLDLLANLLLIYPQIKTELSCFTLPAVQRSFNLFFSVKEVEKAASYLEQKGIQRNRILLKGYGSSFPLARNPTGATIGVATKLNHRLEIGLHNEENEPVITNIEKIPVPDNILDPVGARFNEMRHGLYYSVQIASISQMLQNSNMEVVEEMFVDIDNAQGYYKYMAGMLPSFSLAEKKLAEMQNLGFGDAFIVAYIDGIRISKSDMAALSSTYPDLLLYLEKN